jgi:hypothetical protein
MLKQFSVFFLGLIGPSAHGQNGSAAISAANLPAYVSPFIGVEAPGGTVAACPPGQMMVGIAGTRANMIKTLTPLCGSLNKNGSIGIIAPIDPSAVATGIRGFRLQCSAAHTVTQVRVSFDRMNPANQYLGGVEIGCSSWLLSRWTGPLQLLATADFNAWDVRPSVACRNETQPIRALQIRAVTAVKALSIVCDEI